MKLVREKAKLVELRNVPEALRQRRLLGRREKAERDLSDGRPRAAAAVLDETDSGLDIDALKVVSNGVNALRDPARAFVVVTHYQRLLDHRADQVHVLSEGRIVRSGDKSLAPRWKKGYSWVKEDWPHNERSNRKPDDASS